MHSVLQNLDTKFILSTPISFSLNFCSQSKFTAELLVQLLTKKNLSELCISLNKVYEETSVLLEKNKLSLIAKKRRFTTTVIVF